MQTLYGCFVSSHDLTQYVHRISGEPANLSTGIDST
jgi:hypothetical protein